jgi:hypothetical protein
MSVLRTTQWKLWCKLWKRREKRLTFYKVLGAFQERNNLSCLFQASKRKQKLYKKRTNFMYKQKLKRLLKKHNNLKKKIIKFQLKYGIYDE